MRAREKEQKQETGKGILEAAGVPWKRQTQGGEVKEIKATHQS